MRGPSPIGRAESLAAQVISQIERLILSGDWTAGHRLPAEPILAVQFGVSRSVVRDAMQNLAARGLVEVRQGSGTTVATPTHEAYADAILTLLLRSSATVGDLFDARAVIEASVVRAAAARRTDEDCASLRRHVEAMENALCDGDWRAAFDEDLAFHLSIIRATHLSALITILGPLHHVIASSLLVPDVENVDLFDTAQHRRIYEAIDAGDADAAGAAMAEHFSARDDPAFAALYETRCSDSAAARRGPSDSMRVTEDD